MLIAPIVSLNLLNLVQTLIITLGLLVGSLIVASRITRGQSNTSDFVVFITYYAQVGILFFLRRLCQAYIL
jgi:ABC-type transport system involved in Fe-S cluster assembly fused permease/ATPase subunit